MEKAIRIHLSQGHLSVIRRFARIVRCNRWVAGTAALLLCLAGVAFFARTMTRVFPIQDWLVWTLAQIWGWVLLFSLCTFCFGQFVLVRILKMDKLSILESTVFSAAVGTVGFSMAMYAAGALALYNPIFAVALPPVLLAIGGRDGLRMGVRVWRCLAASRYGVLPAAASAFGAFCVGLLYLGVLSPDAVNYDASWYHLRIAQDYARWGRIAPFTDYSAIVPHLASILHTWGYLVPGLAGPTRWMMALHMEFALFLWTLVGVAAGVQRLTNDFNLRASWVAFFLFPIIFVYDSNIGGAADHVLAFFAVPVLLATLQLQNGFNKGRCALLSIVFAGAALTKYQAVYLAVPIIPIVIAFWIRDWIRAASVVASASTKAARRELLWAPVILVGLCVALVSPHFIKNYLFHRNPVYPFLLNVFTKSTPIVPNASVLVDNILVDPAWVPTGSFSTRFWHATDLFLNFSVKPHYSFTKDVPAFGSLFTLLLPGLLLVRARRNIAIAAFIATGALLVWGMTYNVDRNLQTFLPIMVCVTGALLVKLWQLGPLARLGLVPLVALQLIWGADAPFYGIEAQLSSGMALIRSTYEGRAKSRFNDYRSDFMSLGKAMPIDAKLLLHGSHVNLGIDRDTFQDVMGFQGLISYHKARTPQELYDYLRSLGITHMTRTQVVWDSSRQEQILYDLFLSRYAVFLRSFGGIPLNAMPTQPPPVEQPYHVLCLGLYGYANGLYPIEAMNVNEHLAQNFRNYPAPEREWDEGKASELVGAADAILVRNLGSWGDVASMVASGFESIPTHGDEQVYARRR